MAAADLAVPAAGLALRAGGLRERAGRAHARAPPARGDPAFGGLDIFNSTENLDIGGQTG